MAALHCHGRTGRREATRGLLTTVNDGAAQGQYDVTQPWADLGGRRAGLVDLLDPTTRDERDEDDLVRRGLCLDLPLWSHHVFEVTIDG